jgi:hypothetical protein
MNFIDDRVIMETEFFATTCRAYYGEFTFLEAYQRTGRCAYNARRMVNIVCTRSKEFSTAPIVLNYLNTPHVYIWFVADRSHAHRFCLLVPCLDFGRAAPGIPWLCPL